MSIFQSYNLSGLKLSNKIVMAPMTRCRAINNIPNQLVADYYKQRSGAGLIVSEGASPSPNGLGYARIPGTYSDEQIQGWKLVSDAVHSNAGKIFIQLMHCGRVVAKPNLPEGAEIVAPSPIQAAGEMYTDSDGMVPHGSPRALSIAEIKATQLEYVTSSKRLVNEANVDGVELHGANGYLIDQFLNPKSNHREDEYGVDYKGRARFLIELTQQTADAIGADKVGVRLSPGGAFNDLDFDYPDLEEMYVYVAEELSKIGIAYIHIVDHSAMGTPQLPEGIKEKIKKAFKHTVIVGGGVNTLEQAESLINDGFDLVFIGRPFISNPDLVDKLEKGEALTEPNADLFYSAGAEGYTDY